MAWLSDDTALTLATCEALVETGGEIVPDRIAQRFRTWFEAGRVPGVGAATLKALRDLSAGAHWALAGARGEFAAGAGAAMRAAPLAFVADPRAERDRAPIRDVCRITHHNDEAYAGALAVVAALRVCAEEGAVPPNLLIRVAGTLPDTAVADRIREVAAHRSPESASSLGTSGYVVDAVPLAILVAAKHDRCLEDTIQTAVRLGGDSDTIAAIAAQIVGAAGVRIPAQHWRSVRGGDEVERIAQAFAQCVAGQ